MVQLNLTEEQVTRIIILILETYGYETLDSKNPIIQAMDIMLETIHNSEVEKRDGI